MSWTILNIVQYKDHLNTGVHIAIWKDLKKGNGKNKVIYWTNQMGRMICASFFVHLWSALFGLGQSGLAHNSLEHFGTIVSKC